MLHVVYKKFWINKIKKLSLSFFFSFFILSCNIIPVPNSSKNSKEITKTFFENYDILWKVAQKSFQKYPIKNTNYEQGSISSQWIRVNSIWKDPSVTSTKPLYQILINLIKNSKNKTITVRIRKNIKTQKNFFTSEADLNSNSIEEKIILYRIIQELRIYKKLNPN